MEEDWGESETVTPVVAPSKAKAKDYFENDEVDDEEATLSEEKVISPKVEEEKVPIPVIIPILSSEEEYNKMVKEGSISPKLWSTANVTEFLTMNGCDGHVGMFKEMRTDGRKFLMFNKETLALKMDLKDALVVSRIISKLRILEDSYVKKHTVAIAIHTMPVIDFRIPKRKNSQAFLSGPVSHSPLESPGYPDKRIKLGEDRARDRYQFIVQGSKNTSQSNNSEDDWGNPQTTAKAPQNTSLVEDDWGNPQSKQSADYEISETSFSSRGDRGGGFRGRSSFRGGRGGHGGDGGGSGQSGARDGDWMCSCGTSNFASRYECYRCKTSKPSDNSSTSGSGGNGQFNTNSSKPLTSNDDDCDWGDSQPQATAPQSPGSVKDDWGDPQPKHSDFGESSFSSQASRGNRDGGFRGRGSFRGGRGGRGGGGSGARDGDWMCSCGTSNFASRYECYRCKTSKPSGDSSTSGSSGNGLGQFNTNSSKPLTSGDDDCDWGDSQPQATAPRSTGPVKDDWGDPQPKSSDFGETSFSSQSSRGNRDGGFRGRSSFRGGRGGRDGGGSGARDGDWMCSCGTSNYASRYDCYRCKTSKPSGDSFASGGGGNGQGSTNSSKPLTSNDDDCDWGD